MAQLNPSVVEAFQKLGLEPSASQADATKAYKTLALQNHPDRNFGDSTATARFQEIGEAWSICSRHYEHPGSSYASNFGTRRGYSEDDDDDVSLDDDDREEFFRWVFEEVFMGRFTRANGQRYRSQRAGTGSGGSYMYSGGFTQPRDYQASNLVSQAKEREAFDKRVQEFEREQAEALAESQRLEREEALSKSRSASAHVHAFKLATEGKAEDLRHVVEKNALDVNKPRSQKDIKTTNQIANFTTMLHFAAGSADLATVECLLEKGANTAAMDQAFLTPFHTAILRGNLPVARHLLSLYRNTKSTDPKYQSYRDGCHPSKSVQDKSGTTPLQLAIKSGNPAMVDLLMKDATVHDVEKCWKMIDDDQRSGPIGQALQMKNGFVPPTSELELQLSKKALRKLKLAEEEARLSEEKAQRLAEAEDNRLRKLARKEQAAKEREVKEAEATRVREEAEKLQQIQAQREEAARHEAEMAARKVAEHQRKLEAERAAKLKQQEAEQAAKLKQQEAEQAAKLKQQEAELAAKLKQQEALTKQKADAERAKVAAAAEAAERARQAELQQVDAERVRARAQQAKQQAELLEWDRARRATANAERQAELKRHADAETAKQQEQRGQEQAAVRAQDAKVQQQDSAKDLRQDHEQDPAKIRQEETMRKRAEQSARDKARSQRIREERAQAKALESPAPDASIPTSKVPAQTTGAPAESPKSNRQRFKRGSSHALDVLEAAPAPAPQERKYERKYEPYQHAPPSPPMTPEDFQSMPIPEDLFMYEPPAPALPPPTQSIVTETLPPTPASSSRSLRTPAQAPRGRGRGRGRSDMRSASNPFSHSDVSSESGQNRNAAPCRFFNMSRGCARGSSCAFAHIPRSRVPRETAMEEELARKNLELERMRAELAAARAHLGA